MAAPSPTIDIESDVFALRLANLLRSTRLEHGRSLPALAKASGGRYTREQLRRFEEGGTGLGEDVVEDLSELYGADLGTILPSRLPVAITGGVISAGGLTATFVATNGNSLLTAYLRLIRSMRRQKKAPMIVLRRDDIEVIAEYLDEPGETIVDRLTALMGATLTQRTAMATMFATGAIVIGLAGSTAARSPETVSGAGPRLNDYTAEVVIDAPTTLDELGVAVVVDGAPDVPVVGLDEAVRADAHEVGSPGAVATVADITPDAGASASSGASAASPGAEASDADLAPADATSTDAPAVPAATPSTTVVDSGSYVIPDLPYGNAVVIDDGSDPWTSVVPWGSNIPANGTSTDAPPVAVDTPTTLPAVVATDTPPLPIADAPIVPVVGEVPMVKEVPSVEVASEAPGPEQTLVADTAAAETPVVQVTTPVAETRAERRAAVKQAKQHLKAADKVAAKVARIDAKATAATERATNKIYIEADEERVAALKVIYAQADIAIARASLRIYANGGGPKADATMASVEEEIYAKADADKEEVLDRLYARADAEKAEVAAVIEAKAAASRAALDRP